jgi:hypothetical protein
MTASRVWIGDFLTLSPLEVPMTSRLLVEYACPQCNEKMDIPARNVGKKLPCAKCKAPVTVPMPEEAPVPAPTQAEAADPTVDFGVGFKCWKVVTKIARSDAGKAVIAGTTAAAALLGVWMGWKMGQRR